MELLKLSMFCNVENLQFVELSQCKITDSLFNQIPVKYPVLEIFLLRHCQEITGENTLQSKMGYSKIAILVK